MKELKAEAKRHHERKLHAYGGKCHAHGGRAGHPDIKEDEALIRKEVKPEALKHRADGGPIMGGGKMPSLGRHRRPGGGKKGTNVNVIMAGKPGGDAGPGAPPPSPLPPAALAALQSRPAGPMMPPPRPPMGVPAGGPAGPMKRGGAARKHHHGHEKRH